MVMIMKCLRCGYCCTPYDVIVPLKDLPDDYYDNLESYNLEDYAKHKPAGEKCWNLSFDESGKAVCLIHEEEFYVDCPCDQFGQIERGNTYCRMGEYQLKFREG